MIIYDNFFFIVELKLLSAEEIEIKSSIANKLIVDVTWCRKEKLLTNDKISACNLVGRLLCMCSIHGEVSHKRTTSDPPISEAN